MNQKFVLTLAASLTAFVLVVGGAITGRLARPPAAVTSPTAADIQNIYTQREAEFQARLDEANKALAEAYAQQNTTGANDATASTQPQGQNTATPNVKLTPQGAMSAAIIAVPGAKILRIPELVNFQGKVAYEVKLDLGVVYIDPNNGAVLYNGAIQPQAPALGRGEHDDDHELDGD